MSRRTNQAGIDLIKVFERCVLHVYNDAVNKPTIGYGHLIKAGESFSTITQEEAEDLLRNDLIQREKSVERLVKASLTDNQFAALVSFTFNLGAGNLQNSTLLMKLNRGEYDGAAEEFEKWVFAGGKKLAGLVRRRQAERDLFLTQDSEVPQANPVDPGPVAAPWPTQGSIWQRLWKWLGS